MIVWAFFVLLVLTCFRCAFLFTCFGLVDFSITCLASLSPSILFLESFSPRQL